MTNSRNKNGWHCNPSAVGLEIIASMQQENLHYEFNVLTSFRHKDGKVFWGNSQGCSCPMEFEEHWFNSPEDTSLTLLNEASIEAFRREVESFSAEQGKRFAFERDTLKELSFEQVFCTHQGPCPYEPGCS
jgi:hypothetical protein